MSDQAPAAPAPSAAPASTPSKSPSTSLPSRPTAPASPVGASAGPMTRTQFLESVRQNKSVGPDHQANPLAPTPSETRSDATIEAEGSDAPEQDFAPETQDQSDPSDNSWLDQYKDGVHGLSVQELLAELAEGRIPEALWDKLRMPLQDGDETWEDTLANARNGAMMRKNYTRKLQEFSQQRQQFEQEQNDLVGYLSAWKSDPQQLLFGLQRLGMPVLETARLLATDMDKAEQLNAAVPGSGDEWLESKRIQAEYADLQRQRQQQEKQQREAQTQAQMQKQVTAIRGAAVQEAKAAGLDWSPGAWNAFKINIEAIANDKGGAPLNQRDVREAVLATKSQIDGYVSEHRAYQTQRQSQAAPTLGGKSPDGGAPKNRPTRAPKQNENMTSADFLKKIRGR